MSKKKDKELSDKENISSLVYECISTHNEPILIELIYRLQKEYVDVAKLSTMGEYKSTWTHEQVLNYITINT